MASRASEPEDIPDHLPEPPRVELRPATNMDTEQIKFRIVDLTAEVECLKQEVRGLSRRIEDLMAMVQ